MERLTYRQENQHGEKTDSVIFNSTADGYKHFYESVSEKSKLVYQRLAAYEDTNLTPDAITALVAEVERLKLVVLDGEVIFRR